jgi:hypothetical protein
MRKAKLIVSVKQDCIRQTGRSSRADSESGSGLGRTHQDFGVPPQSRTSRRAEQSEIFRAVWISTVPVASACRCTAKPGSAFGSTGSPGVIPWNALCGRGTDRNPDGKPPGGADGLDCRAESNRAGASVGNGVSSFFIGSVGRRDCLGFFDCGSSSKHVHCAREVHVAHKGQKKQLGSTGPKSSRNSYKSNV